LDVFVWNTAFYIGIYLLFAWCDTEFPPLKKAPPSALELVPRADHARFAWPKQRICFGLLPSHKEELKARSSAAKTAGNKWQKFGHRSRDRGQILQFAPSSIAGRYFIH
jgi:hypothetical protein